MGRPPSVHFSKFSIGAAGIVPDVDYVRDHLYLSLLCGMVVKLSVAARWEPLLLGSCCILEKPCAAMPALLCFQCVVQTQPVLAAWAAGAGASAVTGLKIEVSSNACLCGNVRLPFRELLWTEHTITAPCLPFSLKSIAQTLFVKLIKWFVLVFK